jgi:hypothetical protein
MFEILLLVAAAFVAVFLVGLFLKVRRRSAAAGR